MKKLSLLRLSLCSLLCILLSFPAFPLPVTADATVEVSVPAVYGQTEARAMLDDINAFRTGGEAWYWNSSDSQKIQTGKLSPLAYSYDLEKVAMQRAAEIALTFEHTRPDGRSCFTAADDLHVDPGSYCGENIAAGYPSAESVYIGWREDDDPYAGQGHRRNMLGDFTHIGIGHAVVEGVHYWVQELGKGASVGSPNADGSATVSVAAAESRVAEFTPDDIPALSLAAGKQQPLPAVTGRLRFANSWRTPTVSLFPVWTGGGNVAVPKDGSITGKTTGSTVLTASLFGKTLSLPVTVSCSAHVFGEWTEESLPSCTESGSRSRKCSLCGEVENRILPALGHDYKETVSADGTRSFVCSRCGAARNFLPGDLNGDGKVTPADRTVLARHLAKWKGFGKDDIQFAAADLNGDGKVTSADRTVLARALAKWAGYVL